MSYRVLIVIKDQWWSDQLKLATFAAAQRHRNDVAAQWNDCDTAIAAPDGRVLAYEDSLVEQATFAEVLAEQARERAALEQAPASTSRASRASAFPSPSVPTKNRG
jgi:hypothetical protein